MKVKRGEIYYCDLGDGYKSEQGGLRPVVVIQNNIGNNYSPTTIVAAITTKHKHKLPTHVDVEDSVKYPSTVLCEQIYTVDKNRLIKKLTHVSDETMKKINKAIITSILKEC